MKESFAEIRKFLAEHGVTLVAVSKTITPAEILKIYEEGQRVFGENKVQELIQKYEVLPRDIEWHLVGHLQTNKVKYIASFVSLVHSVDSFKLLGEIDLHGEKFNRVIDVLIQVHIAEEETKYGLRIAQARQLLADDRLYKFDHLRIRGLMGMATLTDDQNKIRKEFQSLKLFYDEVQLKLRQVNIMSDIMPSKAITPADFNILSMGMSSDYRIAIEEGSNMVRIGSAIFGERVQQ